ncbi:MAG TPA: ATP-binding protein [Planctomycetaceae bacterium]|nr:ATP-binding protein [Planctomycetaceae bacterium]
MSIAREGLESSAHVLGAGGSHFFAGEVHQEALARLEHLVESGSRCALVVGPRGTGKSTVLNVFAQDCRAAGCETITIDVTGRDGMEFLERLSLRLGVTSRARGRATVLWTEVADALGGRERAGQRCVLIIDHLDRGTRECQQFVRRLSTRGVERSTETWILALSGRLFPMVPREWRECSDLRVELAPLGPLESHSFLQSLLISAGCPNAFEGAWEPLLAAGHGIPAELRRIGELALLVAEGPQARLSEVDLEAILGELRGLRFSA